MARGIMIFGSSGAGKTTLGKLVAQQLGFTFIDIDDYIWRTDTPVPFSAMYSRSEKINRLMDAISQTEHFVMAGSMDSFHEHFDPFFDLAVHLTASAQLRAERVSQREYAHFGDRILEGGDMYESHKEFLRDISSYDFGGGSMSLAKHMQWANTLPCKVLNLDGGHDLSSNVRTILDVYSAIRPLEFHTESPANFNNP